MGFVSINVMNNSVLPSCCLVVFICICNADNNNYNYNEQKESGKGLKFSTIPS